MSEKESCAAFFIPHIIEENSRSLQDIAAEIQPANSEIKTIGERSYLYGQWGGLYSRIEIHNIKAHSMVTITFLFHDFVELLEEMQEVAEQKLSNNMRQFVLDFANACDVLIPDLALVEFMPAVSTVDMVRSIEEPLLDGDFSYIGSQDFPLLYFGPELANQVTDSDLERPRDEVPMRRGRLFYHGSGADRWDLL